MTTNVGLLTGRDNSLGDLHLGLGSRLNPGFT